MHANLDFVRIRKLICVSRPAKIGYAARGNSPRLADGEMLIEIAKVTLLILGFLALVGGFIGYTKAKSKPSLISGVVSAFLLNFSYFLTRSHLKAGLIAGDVVCVALLVVFAWRLKKTAKFMPAGLMMILSGVSAVVVSVAIAIV